MRVVFLGRDRKVWQVALLYLVTFGIYRRVWLFKVNKEIDGHEALGLNHRLTALLLFLPILGPAIVAIQTARRGYRMTLGTVKFGSPWILGFAALIPILGAIPYMTWSQNRFNRFWAAERTNSKKGIEIDVRLDDDPAFLIELGNAIKESYHPGSRFDERRNARRKAMARRKATFVEIQEERAAVRRAGGSTPVLPFMRPKLPEPRTLHVGCSRCDTRFDVTQHPVAPTPLICPKCGLNEVLPALSDDPLRPLEKAAVPVLKATCPKCKNKFTGVRNLHGATRLTCPVCGRVEMLAATKAA